MPRVVIFLFLASLFLSCRGDRPLTETSNGKDGMGSAEKPIEKVIQGIRFQQKGLEIDSVKHTFWDGRALTAGDSVSIHDTVDMPLYVRGWHAPEGIARIQLSSVIRRADGSVAHAISTSKQIVPYEINDGVIRTMMPFSDLDSSVSYYDHEFTITDVGNGRSLTGTYRYHLR